VIGHNVDDQAEARAVQRLDKHRQTRFAAQFRIYVAEVDDIVAVHRAGPGREDRRGIDVGNAEVAQISGDARAVMKGEAFVKLETVGRGEILVEFAERPHSTAPRAQSPQRERVFQEIVPVLERRRPRRR